MLFFQMLAKPETVQEVGSDFDDRLPTMGLRLFSPPITTISCVGKR